MTEQPSANQSCGYALALHTSSSELGLALSNIAGDSRQQVWALGRELSTYLHSCLQEFLYPYRWQQLSWLAVAKGPGSFTSTRIGIVVARTLAQQLSIPLFAVSTLAAIAWMHRHNTPIATDLAVSMPAQRGEVYAGIYRLEPMLDDNFCGCQRLVAVLPDTVMPQSQWQTTLDEWEHPHQQILAGDCLGSSVMGILALADEDWRQGLRPHWSTALPFYGQHPVAIASP
ncbi:MAG: tRNA (adenosine(37)-N6)-threonylcarbamoyltransferase complex dimerization subunit type 1 TsaB [Cyanobacteria bacterium]|nr:tRNA (adenosine(37)-N6)-threonylcarbamoyltransferase complex dimerization subunit type 1 TsaB [Cyanobacteriota bacterium]MDW8199878.1 tRNA (adenosine(37)-N6)-threonylcarbamoyltransferase complex dimerization subunit type 1 TsaB [Cyanobacteriota bacterium SKYGB_h_bin112]